LLAESVPIRWIIAVLLFQELSERRKGKKKKKKLPKDSLGPIVLKR
jgi:hypothetical protein